MIILLICVKKEFIIGFVIIPIKLGIFNKETLPCKAVAKNKEDLENIFKEYSKIKTKITKIKLYIEYVSAISNPCLKSFFFLDPMSKDITISVIVVPKDAPTKI